jgi:hypothetical protein
MDVGAAHLIELTTEELKQRWLGRALGPLASRQR